jgi:hypothetical protein
MQNNVAKKRKIQAFLEEDAISQKPMEERTESWASEKQSVQGTSAAKEAAETQRRCCSRAGAAQREKRENGERGDQVTGRTCFTGSVAIISVFYF